MNDPRKKTYFFKRIKFRQLFFRQKSQLKLHLQRHDGVKKYDCNQCDVRFLAKADLERHEKSHEGKFSSKVRVLF